MKLILAIFCLLPATLLAQQDSIKVIKSYKVKYKIEDTVKEHTYVKALINLKGYDSVYIANYGLAGGTDTIEYFSTDPSINIFESNSTNRIVTYVDSSSSFIMAAAVSEIPELKDFPPYGIDEPLGSDVAANDRIRNVLNKHFKGYRSFEENNKLYTITTFKQIPVNHSYIRGEIAVLISQDKNNPAAKCNLSYVTRQYRTTAPERKSPGPLVSSSSETFFKALLQEMKKP